MAEAGILDEDERVELIDGRIIRMTPIGGPHFGYVNRLNRMFVSRTPPEITVSVQNPVRLGRYQEPQPDIALLGPGAEPNAVPGAEQVLLIVEVADTSVARDRDVKLPRYAAAGVPEVWLVLLADDAIEVYRRPGPQGYGERLPVGRGAEITLAELPALGSFAVREILGC